MLRLQTVVHGEIWTPHCAETPDSDAHGIWMRHCACGDMETVLTLQMMMHKEIEVQRGHSSNSMGAESQIIILILCYKK